MVEDGKRPFAARTNIVGLDDYREEKNLVPHEAFADLKERQFAQSAQDPLPEEADYYDTLISSELCEEQAQMGIFGVGIRGIQGTIHPILDDYLNPLHRDVVRKHNIENGDTMTYMAGTADRLELDMTQVEAAVLYYFQHQEAFDAFRLVTSMMAKRDVRIDQEEE